MTSFLSILAALVLISLLVTAHEFGHFAVGRLFHFDVVEFSVGMGPALLKTKGKNGKGTVFSLRALPIGGMCRFYGEDQEVRDDRCFNAHPAWQRILVVLAGPVMNLLMALLLSMITLSLYGNYAPAVYETPEPGSPAYEAGLLPGDLLLSVNGKSIRYYSETVDMIRAADSGDMTLVVLREGVEQTLVLHDVYDAAQGYNYIGITITPARRFYGVIGAVGQSFGYVGGMVRDTFSFFGTLFSGEIASTDVAGPVGTIAYISEAVRYGFETVLRLAILINISLGIFNLLPVPALDGGRLVFLVIEWIRGKAIDPQKEGMVHFVGLILLFGLILFLTYNDIVNLVRG